MRHLHFSSLKYIDGNKGEIVQLHKPSSVLLTCGLCTFEMKYTSYVYLLPQSALSAVSPSDNLRQQAPDLSTEVVISL